MLLLFGVFYDCLVKTANLKGNLLKASKIDALG